MNQPKPSKLARPFAGLLVAMVALAVGPAWSHGKQDHGQAHAAAKKEQKPWGIAGDTKKVGRSITVSMNDAMRFVPDRIEVQQGETVRLRVRNDGKVLHELVIGTRQELDAHAALMAKFPNMEHDEPYMVHVEPGQQGEIVWTFNRTGEFDFACLIAGHYQAGMVGKIVVHAKTKGSKS